MQAKAMDMLSKGDYFLNCRTEVLARIAFIMYVAKCLGLSWMVLEIFRLHREVFQQPLWIEAATLTETRIRKGRYLAPTTSGIASPLSSSTCMRMPQSSSCTCFLLCYFNPWEHVGLYYFLGGKAVLHQGNLFGPLGLWSCKQVICFKS